MRGPEPDGRYLAGGLGSSVFIWRFRLEDLIDLAGRTAGRNLTLAEWRLYFLDSPYHRTFPDLPDPADREVRPKAPDAGQPERPDAEPESSTPNRAVALRPK